MRNRIVLVLTVIAILCFGVTTSFAKLYSAAPAGQGTSTIGTGGDYPSIYAASLDFNATPNTGNWTMQILNNLSEISVCCFGNNVPSSNTVTLMPGPGVNATVTFAETTTQAPTANGKYGQFLVGYGQNTVVTTSVYTVNNFVINGSNNGSNSQNLTFLRPDNYVGFNYMFHTVGCPGFTFENCSVLNRYATMTTVTGATTAFTGYVFYMDIDYVSGNDDTLLPDGFKILNNYIEVTAGDNFYEDSRAFYIGNNIGVAYTLGVDHFPRNWIIDGNTILAGNRTVWFLRNGSGTFTNNTVITIHHEPGNTPGFAGQGGLPIGLWLGYDNGGGQGVLDANNFQAVCTVANNYFLTYIDTTSATLGCEAVGIGLDGNHNLYYVYNNQIITAYKNDANQPAPLAQLYGFFIGVAAPLTGSVFNIYNNSIDIPNNPLTTSIGGRYTAGIYDGSASNTLNIKNNLIRIGMPGGFVYDFSSTGANTDSNTTLCDYNTFYCDTANGCVIARLEGLSDYSTLAQWQTSGLDANGQFIDPFITSPSAWISNIDLHFNRFIPLNGSPNPSVGAAPLAAGTPIALVTNDIDGQTRSGSVPWRGADELYTSPYVTPISIFGSPGDAPVAIIVAGGTAPFSWSLSTSAIGSLDTLSGSSVNFTAGHSAASGTITVTDSSVPVQTATVSVVITPTYAPMVNDITMVPLDSKDVIRFSLFE